MTDKIYIPDHAISIHDPNAFVPPNVNHVRWDSSTSLELEIPEPNTDRPYVEIDLNDPNGEFYLKVFELLCMQ